MTIQLASAPFLISVLLAGIMGFAIQRGATCMVAAVDEVVSKRRFSRLTAMLSASLWVLVGLIVTQALGVLPKMPTGYAVTGWTVVGGALLGFGAFVGRACVFGAIARFGNGEWSYLMVPVGFLAGCATVAPLFMPMMPKALPHASAVFDGGLWIGALATLLLLARALRAERSDRNSTQAPRSGRQRFATRAWSPGTATAVIGITFFFMMLLVGPWAYTEALADVARNMPHDLSSRGILMLALFAGAFTGGLTAGRFGSTRVTAPRLARCFVSGLLMGWGSLLIPGGNDGLILVGMPLLFAYAWVAMVSMAAAIGGAMVATRALAAPAGISPDRPDSEALEAIRRSVRMEDHSL
jgi:toxin CptA